MPILSGFGGEAAYKQAEAQRRIAERKYYQLLTRLVRDIISIIKTSTDENQIIRRINDYAESLQFADLAHSMAQRMVTGALVGQRATWRTAAAESTRGRKIYEALKRETENTSLGLEIDKIIQRNSTLISTVPHSVAQRLSKLAYEKWEKGIRHEQIVQQIASMAPQLTRAQIKRIARTESAKASSALMEARCDSIGITYYCWHTCHDERVRASHAKMDGILCRWNDPPNPEALFGGHDSGGSYHPGGIYNCRCIALPVVDEKDIKFPCKVHSRGKVITVNNLNQLHKLVA